MNVCVCVSDRKCTISSGSRYTIISKWENKKNDFNTKSDLDFDKDCALEKRKLLQWSWNGWVYEFPWQKLWAFVIIEASFCLSFDDANKGACETS